MELATPGIQGKWLIHYTTGAPTESDIIKSETDIILSSASIHVGKECEVGKLCDSNACMLLFE